MIQHFEDMEKAVADVAALERKRQLFAMKFASSAVVVDGHAGTSGAQQRMPPSLLLQQTPLPTFDGRTEQWHKFKARYCDIVDRSTQDSPATKLHYLDKALVGEAKGAIDEQTLNDNNYEGAWRILIERYENLPMVIHGHVTNLLNLKPMARESSLELRTLIDDCTKRVESLEFHKLKMDKMAEAIVITLLTSKLDPSTRRSWEASCEHGKLPIFKDTIAFLRKHSHVLERCEQNVIVTKNKVATFRTQTPSVTSKTHTVMVAKANDGCPVCGTAHSIEACGPFKKLSVNERYTKAKQLGLCFGCLQRGHRTTTCKTSKVCPTCTKKHHVLMHPEEKSVAPETTQPPATGLEKNSTQPLIAAKCTIPIEPMQTKQILLATAVVMVYDSSGEAHKCRMLLDSGAMANFMSTRMVELLRLQKESANVSIDGVNGMKTLVKYKVHAKMESRTTKFESSLDCLVVPRVTGALPALKIDLQSWHIPESVLLADPYFYEPGRIDMLVGAELFFEVLEEGKIRLSPNLPLLQESQLGWLVSGPVAETAVIDTVKVCHAGTSDTADEQLCEMMKQFWTIDEFGGDASLSSDNECELNFLESHCRTKEGRYVVKFPFRETVGKLGESRKQAMQRFMALERRLDRHLDLKQMYVEFINEYLALGHCRVVPSAECENPEFAYYLPHHCVMKPASSTTKLRVVFDASAKSSTDLSLNDVMEIGPTVQESLFNILLRFRWYKFVFTADVLKMYRQVMVDKAHRKYQWILWRDSKEQPIKELELNTVTYGTAAAPFLATRAILQLARDEQSTFPAASEVVEKCFYVDDVMTGADTLDDARQLQKDLIALLHRGGFQLHKWCANDEALLEDIPIYAQEKQLDFNDSEVNGVIKTLGILWDPFGDEFMFHVNPVVLWSDSKIVLSWLKQMKSGTPVFVKNHVMKIRKLFTSTKWHYISTQHNPADLVSRGVFPADLMRCEQWWSGPCVLPIAVEEEGELELVEPEEAEQVSLHQIAAVAVPQELIAGIAPEKQRDPYDVILNHSSYRKLQLGRELIAVAEPLYEDLKETSLSRYQLVQKRMQHFWQRWSNEYVTGLQKRSKWYKDPTQLQNGLLVVLKEDNMPPKTWKLGRIIETHPGKDGIIRVVTIRTSNNTYKRPTTQIAVLPIDDCMDQVESKAK
ncbi:uncharacterized protein LOC135701162 [Ochlerotatus camptorhynchus]|uniref:uncharacterized protein LOC135701162 n=1 Tax=Ochlerotatus camptorhynchus TaxID=644619 RepID=UPI0031E10852